MRNLCFAAASADQRKPKKQSAFLLAYVQEAKNSAETAAEFAAFKEMLLPHVAPRVGATTYEQIAEVLRGNREPALADWLEQRIQTGLQAVRSTLKPPDLTDPCV